MVIILSVLFIDDNPELGILFKMFLENEGDFSVHTCQTGEEALEYLNNNTVSAVVSDYNMPEMDGVTILKKVRESYPRLPFIMLTAVESKEAAIDALNSGADFYQNKGDDFEVQVLDLAHKIRVLSARAVAEEAAIRKDAILEAISYAAGRLLKSDNWEKEMEEIVSHLGEASSAIIAFVSNISRENSEIDEISDQLVIWQKSAGDQEQSISLNRIIILLSREIAKKSFAKEEPVIISRSDSFIPWPEFSGDFHLETLVFLPIHVGETLWGFFGIGREMDETLPISPVEMHTLKMAADLIGASRYRLYIEELFRNPVEESLVGVFFIRNQKMQYVNPRLCEIFQYSREEIMSQDPLSHVHPEDLDYVRFRFREVMDGALPSAHFEYRGRDRHGEDLYLEIYLTTLLCEGERCAIGNLMDITERRNAEIARQESESRFRDLFTNIRDLVLLHQSPEENNPGQIIEINAASKEILGYEPDELYHQDISVIFPPSEIKDWTVHCQGVITEGVGTSEQVLLRKDGVVVPVEISSHLIGSKGQPALLSVVRDITERKQAEAKIKAGEELLKRNMLISIREKETLLREVHHRVKNNLQIINSLLRLQEYQISDPGVHEIIRDCRNRIYSMVVIHEKIYQTSGLSGIFLDEYIRDIGIRIISEYEEKGGLVHFDLVSSEPIMVDIGTGIPTGLIINELITNSIKYAFPSGGLGMIRVKIEKDGENVNIVVSDSGVGLPADFSEKIGNSLGVDLVNNLAYQLGGSAEWKTDHGTVCTVIFPLNSDKQGKENAE